MAIQLPIEASREAFLLAERQDEMATFEAGLGDNGSPLACSWSSSG